MNRSFAAPLIAFVALVAGVIGCSEKLESGDACPLLCPQESVALRDTIIDAIAFDTTVTGLPPIGSEDYLILAKHGDSLDTRILVRYDTLQQTFSHGAIDSTISRVDSAYIRLIQARDTLHKPALPVTIELYDVYTAATDTVASVLLPLFRPDRLLSSTTFAPESLTAHDTLRVGIANAVILDRITRGAPLRVGMRIVSGESVELRFQSTLTGAGPTLSFRVSPDTAVARFNIAPLSRTPTDKGFVASPLGDYVIIAAGNVVTPTTVLSVGGLPVRRSFLRFRVPPAIVDSSTVIRATLLLTQRPTPKGVRRSDTISVFPVAIVAAPKVTDVTTALQFSTALGTLGLKATRTTPADSGVKQFEVVALIKAWSTVPDSLNPRDLALQSADENQTPGEINFFSTRAPASLRPRLRITYVSRVGYGVP